MDAAGLAARLLEEGGPVLRFRTARDILGEPIPSDELLASPLVRRWLDRLVPDTSFTGIHNGVPTAFENAMGKLVQLGLRAGMAPLDERTRPFCEWLRRAPAPPFAPFLRAIVACHLAAGGYGDDPVVAEVVRHRLELVSEFARERRYDIHVDRGEFRGIPKHFPDQPLIDPALCPEEHLRLPWIHDLVGLAALTPDGAEPIVEYVMDDRYQALHPGYGILRAANGRYYAMGWDVKLPGWSGIPPTGWSSGSLVSRLALLSRFPAARRHRWFTESLA
ncbi:MAG: hypothetical protein ACYTDY_13610, partial [Planctomycetota bacterium]